MALPHPSERGQGYQLEAKPLSELTPEDFQAIADMSGGHYSVSVGKDAMGSEFPIRRVSWRVPHATLVVAEHPTMRESKVTAGRQERTIGASFTVIPGDKTVSVARLIDDRLEIHQFEEDEYSFTSKDALKEKRLPFLQALNLWSLHVPENTF